VTTKSQVLTFVMISALIAMVAPTAAGRGSFATISGSVRDSKGNPLSGAIVSLIKDAAIPVLKEVRTDAEGRFSAKISPGRYAIRAIADGFNDVVFSLVEVHASQALVYRFNLEPVGSGKTLPERRKDRNDVKWTLRSAQTRRSIFQAQEGEDGDINAVLDAEDAENGQPSSQTDSFPETPGLKSRPQGIVEAYAAGSAYGYFYTGMNFALSTPATEHLDLIVAGQTGIGPGAPERLETTGIFRAGDRHRVAISVGGAQFNSPIWTNVSRDQADPAGQFSVRAIDEWIVRDGVVIVLGLDYSRFIGAGGSHSVSPRVGVQFDANARTRVKAAYAPGGEENQTQSVAGFEGKEIVFTESGSRPIAFVDGQAVLERTHRLEFGLERVLDNNSSVETTAFFDTTRGRGVGLLSAPMSAFSGVTGENFINIANQQGSARGMRVVYARRLNSVWSASAGYSFGRGQRLSRAGFANPAELFEGGFFQTAALQLSGSFNTGTHVRTVLRFSPAATVFAIDPFAGQLGVYDPSLSIQVTQDLPSFGLPVRAEAVIDARNLLDNQANTNNGEILTQVSTGHRSLRGGISVRF